MNKQELIDKIATDTNLTKSDCQRVLEAAIDITKKSVKKGDEVRLVGFGTFRKAKRAARRARNPQTGQEIRVKAHWVARFRPGKEFRTFLN